MATPTPATTFGKDIIPADGARRRVGRGAPLRPELRGHAAGTAEPYWRDVGTIDAYWDANIDLTATDPLLNLYDTRWPIWTYQPQLPPASSCTTRTTGAAWRSNRWSGGCIVSGLGVPLGAVLQVRCTVFAGVNWSVLLPGCRWAAARG